MKLHPTYAHQILVEHGVKNPAILSGARDHHEKLDGSGYPRGLKNEDISKFARIIAIADIFNALTTRRSYKPALSTFEALKIMKHQMEGELDPDLLKRFIFMMSEKRHD
jgi:HD-GYP domain-containing protein (c-di-GMP phosphodiesterase class II)